LPLRNLLPEDTASHGFETVADGQQLSHHLLAVSLDVADIALKNAFDRAVNGDVEYREFFTPKTLATKFGGNARGATSRNTVSLDQLMAKQLGHETRVPALVLNTNSQTSPSYTENGSMIPAENNAMRLFTRLFVDDTAAEQERQAELIRRGRSVMDLVGEEARALQRELGTGDRNKLEDWFSSVRDLEQRMVANEAWTHRPKPQVDLKPRLQFLVTMRQRLKGYS
jgi:hypothetical protein